MLLVLDNFDHLQSGVQIVLDIVEQCGNVQLIVTSRESLRVRAEWTLALSPLSYPTSDMDVTPSDAVNLFLARRAQHQRRDISERMRLAAVRSICRLVGGLPLAIELAAALTAIHRLGQLQTAYVIDFDSLTTPLRDVPPRHRGLDIVFEMSWRDITSCITTTIGTTGGLPRWFYSHQPPGMSQTRMQRISPHYAKSRC